MTRTHVNRDTAEAAAEARRLWADTRVWVVNCLAVEAAIATMSHHEQADARRGRDVMLAAFLAGW